MRWLAVLVLAGAAFAQDATIIFKAPDRAITLTIDGEEVKLARKKVHKATLSMGEHLIEAVSEDGYHKYESTLKLESPDSRVIKIELVRDLDELIQATKQGRMEARVRKIAAQLWVSRRVGEEPSALDCNYGGARATLTGRFTMDWANHLESLEAEFETEWGQNLTAYLRALDCQAYWDRSGKEWRPSRGQPTPLRPNGFRDVRDGKNEQLRIYFARGTRLPVMERHTKKRELVRVDWRKLKSDLVDSRGVAIRIPPDAYKTFWIEEEALEFVPAPKPDPSPKKEGRRGK